MDYYALIQEGLMYIGIFTVLKGLFGGGKRHPYGDHIGRIYINGPIVSHSPGIKFKNAVTPEAVETCVKGALEYRVKGLIIEINSGGGEVVPSKEIAEYIKEVPVPTIAVVKGCAASGAYWIASACDQILVNQFSRVGSIGVILSHMEISQLAKQYGIKDDTVKSGEFKDMGSMFRPFTDNERKILQDQLDYAHRGFIIAVAENRELKFEDVEKIANGLTYFGEDAIQKGLADHLGDTKMAVAMLEEMGQYKCKNILDYYPQENGLLPKLLGQGSYSLGRSFANGMLDTLAERNNENLK